MLINTFPVFFLAQGVYGRMGRKPDKPLIEAYEHFTYGHMKDLKSSQMLKVTVSRCVSQGISASQ